MGLRALTTPNAEGDTTIVWEAENDDAMLPIIEKKMKEGVTFFILEPRLEGRAMPAKVKVTAIDQVKDKRAVVIPDEDLAAFVSAGKGAAIPTPDTKARAVRRAKSPREVVQNESIAARPIAGG
ncbi:hypothetical protein [Hyphomicrobium sp.]|uniref:hypothetical protein n=1 Tax=Hyphomicrobium sp. TaxID=82 RepID=UPI001D2310DF|nr:hypothetical protein [Hyphomicrobium sp.]MBY0561484.1 hypothetical protein [Hyphomicrobium sp.]